MRIIVDVQDLPPRRTTSHAVANYCAPSSHISRNHRASLRVETWVNFRSRVAEGLR